MSIIIKYNNILITSRTNNIILFFTLKQGTHTFTVVNGPESRETLASSFKEVFEDVNEIQKNGDIMIDWSRADTTISWGWLQCRSSHMCALSPVFFESSK